MDVKLAPVELMGRLVNVAKGQGPNGGYFWLVLTYEDGRVLMVEAGGAEITVKRQPRPEDN